MATAQALLESTQSAYQDAQADVKACEKFAQLEHMTSRCARALDTANQQLSVARMAYDCAQKRVRELRNQESELLETPHKLERLQADLAQCEQELQRVTTQLAALSEHEELFASISTEFKRLRAIYEQKRSEYRREEETYQHLQFVFLDGQAGVLARELHDDEPCPVCGSRTHPSPAQQQDSVPTQQAVDEQHKRMNASLQKMQKASRECNRVSGTYEAQQRELAQMKEAEGDQVALQTRIDELSGKRAQLQASADAVQAHVDTLERIRARLPEAQRDVDTATTSLESATKAVSTCQQEQANTQSHVAAARETLSMVDAAQARALLTQANTQLTAAQNQIAATRKDAQALEAAHHRIQTQEHQVHESEENLERARDKASSAREELVAAQAAADQLAKSLKFGSRDEAQQALAQLDERIAQLDQTRTQAQDKVRQT